MDHSKGNSSRSEIVVPAAYLAAVIGAEAVGIYLGVVFSTLLHAALILGMLLHAAAGTGYRQRRILIALTLCPLIRILSLGVPTRQVAPIYWFVMIGIPIWVATAAACRSLGLGPAQLGFRRSAWGPQALVTLSGVPLGAVGFLLLDPLPLMQSFEWSRFALGAVILVAFSALLEEAVFRGLVQFVGKEIMGRSGLLLSSVAFAAMYVGSRSGSYLLFMAAVGLFFAWWVDRTRSIWGVVLAHGLLTVGMGLVWPFVL